MRIGVDVLLSELFLLSVTYVKKSDGKGRKKYLFLKPYKKGEESTAQGGFFKLLLFLSFIAME